jgi:hypothetical protein
MQLDPHTPVTVQKINYSANLLIGMHNEVGQYSRKILTYSSFPAIY